MRAGSLKAREVSWELEGGSWELGVWRRELGAGSLEAREVRWELEGGREELEA